MAAQVRDKSTWRPNVGESEWCGMYMLLPEIVCSTTYSRKLFPHSGATRYLIPYLVGVSFC